jgi:hypothetical protein
MSLLDDASLIVTPNAEKATKLYSIIPTNGNGDFSVTRATTATRTNASGLIESVPINEPRFDYSLGSCPNILLEPQRTNLIANSTMVGAVAGSPGTAPTTWTFNGGGGLTRTISLGTENGLNYIQFRYQGTATQSFLTILPNSAPYSSSATQIYSLSPYISLISGTIPNFRLVQLDNAGNSYVTIVSPTATLTRYTATTPALPVGNTTIRPYFDTNALSIGTAYDFTIRIAAPQMELGAYATSYIPTTSASVTRNADVISRGNIFTNGLITASGGTWFVDLRGNAPVIAASSSELSLGIGATSSGYGGAGSLSLWNFNLSSSRIQILKQVGGVFTNLYTTTTDTSKIAIKWNGTTADVFENGVKVVSATSFTPTVMEFFFGSGTRRFLNINSMALFPTPLTDTQCIALTT